MSRFLYSLIICVIFNTTLFAQNCNAELSVQKNRSFKSVSTYGTVYTLELTNNGKRQETFTINSKMLATDCSNGKQRSVLKNAKVNVSLVDQFSKKSKSNAIVVPANTTSTLRIKVQALKDQPVATWGCVEVIAQSDGCTSDRTSVVLSAWIIDPSNQE